LEDKRYRFFVAPMMDWTDRHCRFFHCLITRRALLSLAERASRISVDDRNSRGGKLAMRVRRWAGTPTGQAAIPALD